MYGVWGGGGVEDEMERQAERPTAERVAHRPGPPPPYHRRSRCSSSTPYSSVVSEGGPAASLAAITMASSLPIPRPPRSPTPPSDHPPSPDLPSQNNRNSLSVDTFPPRSPLGSTDPSRLSPAKPSFSSNSTDASMQNESSDNGAAGPFNFTTVSMPKSPVLKSVSIGDYRVFWKVLMLINDSN
jgi:hypothetical protein